MKKLIIAALLLIAFAPVRVFAADADLFSYDKDAISNEFSALNQLETYVIANNGISASDLSSELLTGMKLDLDGIQSPMGINQLMFEFDLSSFLWGLCCWPVGLFTVILNSDKTADQKLSYWIGLGIAVVGGSGGYGGYSSTR